jgi:hypothetical protein
VTAKPWSALAPAVVSTGVTLQRATLIGTKVRAETTRKIVAAEGSPFHIRFRRVTVRLSQRVEVEPGGSPLRWIVGPHSKMRGAWSIVERGSRPHVIMPRGFARKFQRIGTRLSQGKKLQRRQAQIAAQLFTGDRAGLFAGTRPLGLGNGIKPRYAVSHPGHRPHGRPWARSMERAGLEGGQAFQDAFEAEIRRGTR